MQVDPFAKFDQDWALLTAGAPDHFNGMTISWGAMGTIWHKSIITVYVRPDRYTWQFLKDSDAFTVDRSFMTNADVPTLAFADLIADPVNPFTGNPVNDDLKYAAEQHIFSTRKFRIQENNGNTFLPGEWYSVHDDIFDMDNWEKLGED